MVLLPDPTHETIDLCASGADWGQFVSNERHGLVIHSRRH